MFQVSFIPPPASSYKLTLVQLAFGTASGISSFLSLAIIYVFSMDNHWCGVDLVWFLTPDEYSMLRGMSQFPQFLPVTRQVSVFTSSISSFPYIAL